MDAHSNRTKRKLRVADALRRPAKLVVVLVLVSLTGCSLFVMAGKAFFGDPVVDSAFKRATRVNLVASKKKVIVLCTVPESVNNRYPAINQQILEAITRRLKREGIQVINANKVLTWLDDRNGVWDNASEIAQDFDADFIIHIDLSEFTHKAENSPDMYQGKTLGRVEAYRVTKDGDVKRADTVFSTEFSSQYPRNAPMSVNRASGELFLHKYVTRISTELAQMFYDHPASETVY